MTDETMPLEVLRNYLNTSCSRTYDPKSGVMKWQPLVASDGVNPLVVKRSIEAHFGFGTGPNGITVFGESKLMAMESQGFDTSVQTQGIIPKAGRTIN